MKTSRYILVIAALICISTLTTSNAFARGHHHFHHHHSSFRVGIGIGIGYPYSYPYRYHSRSYWEPYYSGYTYWGPYYYPGVVVDTPVVVQRPSVVTAEPVVVKQPGYSYVTRFDDRTLQLNKQLQNKKTELLEKLKLADNEGRKKAIAELGGFSFDEKVKKALEEILLSEPDPELRKEAAKSFASVRNRGAVSILEKVRVEDSDKEVRQEADKAIKDIRGY